MKKGEIILRTAFTLFYGFFIMVYIDRQIEKGEWMSFLSGGSFLAICAAMANHIRHLIHDEVKKDGEADG